MQFFVFQNVVKSQPDGVSGHTYYEQYNISSGTVKLGDFVYVKGREPAKKSIRQICQLWVTAEYVFELNLSVSPLVSSCIYSIYYAQVIHSSSIIY